MTPDEGEYIRSGMFRVDVERAKEKLKEFTLADPERFLIPWLRAACACGPSKIALDSAENWVRLRFDGRALDLSRRQDPTTAFFEENSLPEERYFAAGVLAALRCGPSVLRASSGLSGSRSRLMMRSLGDAELIGLDDGARETELHVAFPPVHSDGELPARCLKHAAEAAIMLKPLMFINGTRWPAVSPMAPLGKFEEQGVRGEIWDLPDGGPSGLQLCIHGVYVNSISYDLGRDTVRIRLDCSDFKLDASQSAVVRDETFKAAIAVLKKHLPPS